MRHEIISTWTNILEKSHYTSFNKYSKDSWHFTKILNFRSWVYSINSFLFSCFLSWVHLLKYYALWSELFHRYHVKTVLICASLQKQLEELDHIQLTKNLGKCSAFCKTQAEENQTNIVLYRTPTRNFINIYAAYMLYLPHQ